MWSKVIILPITHARVYNSSHSAANLNATDIVPLKKRGGGGLRTAGVLPLRGFCLDSDSIKLLTVTSQWVWDSSGGIATTQRAGLSKTRGSIPGSDKTFSFLVYRVSRPAMGLSHPPIQWYWGGGFIH